MAVALVLSIAPIHAQSSSPPLAVRVEETTDGWRPLVELGRAAVDQGLYDPLSSGLPLRFRIRLELWKKAFFDRLIGAEESSLVLVQDPLDNSYLLGDGSTEQSFTTIAAAEGAIRTALSFDLRPTGRGRFYYLATFEVETLSLSDLEELRRWLRGEAAPAVRGQGSPGRAVERGLRRLLVRTLGLPSRRYEARSPTLVVR